MTTTDTLATLRDYVARLKDPFRGGDPKDGKPSVPPLPRLLSIAATSPRASSRTFGKKIPPG